MILFSFMIGFAPLWIIGVLAVRAMQGSSPVLTRSECAVYGAIVGPTLVMTILFLLAWAGMPINATGGATALSIAGIPLLWLVRKHLGSLQIKQSLERLKGMIAASRPTVRWNSETLLRAILGIWILAKLSAGSSLLLHDPAYNDDVFNNWNYRAKILQNEQRLTLEFPYNPGVPAGVAAYPPTVPLIRAWIAIAAGGWNDDVIGLIAPLSYLLALAIIFLAIRREAEGTWALLGLYIASSLPLSLLHGITPYADLFVALHIAAALLPIFHALRSTDVASRTAWLRVGALSAALLPMTKNEALLMHLPIIFVLAAGAIAHCAHKRSLSGHQALRAALWYATLTLAVLLPWLLYKYSNGLAFGNAKSIDTALAWQEGALRALFITWVLETNFLLLPGLLGALLLVRQRAAFGTPLLVLSLFVLGIIAELIGIFSFTGLSAEALRQTGSARGIIQIVPIMVILATLLLRDWWNAVRSS